MLFIAWICNLRRFFNLIKPSTQHLFGSMYLRISKLVNMCSRNFLAWIILYLQGRYRCLNCCIFHRTFGISSLLLIFIMYEKSWDRSKVFRHLKLAIDDGNTLILLLLKFKYLRWIRFPIVVGNWPCVISNPLKSKTSSNLKFWKAGLSFSKFLILSSWTHKRGLIVRGSPPHVPFPTWTPWPSSTSVQPIQIILSGLRPIPSDTRQKKAISPYKVRRQGGSDPWNR